MAKRYSVEITQIAEKDIREIYEYISLDKMLSARQWVRELEHQIESLESFPLRCPVIPESKELGRAYRHLIYGNYRTIFKVIGERVVIMRVIHGARLLDTMIL